jgi:hypothetical protein
VIERAVILSRGGPLRLDLALPPDKSGIALSRLAERDVASPTDVVTDREFRQRERQNLFGKYTAAMALLRFSG